MNKFLIGCAGIAGVCIVLLLSVIVYVVGVNNSYANQESSIQALQDKSKNSLTALMNELPTQGLAIEKYGDMVTKAIQTAITGRYGPNGVKAILTAIQEQNPTIAPEVFLKLQQVITSRYSGFEISQNGVQDGLRIYRADLNTFPRGWIGKNIFGYPKIKFEDFEVVIAGDAKKAFETKKVGPVDPFGKK